MAKLSKPRRGSLAFLPKKRARRAYPSFHSTQRFKKIQETKLLGFAGFKAGMTHVIALEKQPTSLSYGQNISIPVTILECPPLTVFGIRCYKNTPYGMQTLSEIWSEKLNKHLSRKLFLPKKPKIPSFDFSSISKISLLVHTNPPHKKKPEVFEISISGPVSSAFEYAKSILGKTLNISDVFKEGDYIDVMGVTKGKGIKGPVKRWGTKIQYRKAHGKRRHVGVLNPWTPSRTMWTALMSGQLGYHTRTILNSRILKIGEKKILLRGSVPGSRKRLILMRIATRPKKERALPELKEVRGV